MLLNVFRAELTRLQVRIKVCFLEIMQRLKHENPGAPLPVCVLLICHPDLLQLTCPTFICDDDIHSTLYVDKMIDVMLQISKEFTLLKDRGQSVQR